MPFLVCRHLDKHTEWNVDVSGDSFTLGCSDLSIVPLPDRGLAAREAVISREEDRYQLRDLVERDRVLLNGAMTRESLLKDGDLIQLGRIVIRFYEEAPRGETQVALPMPSGAPQALPWTAPAGSATASHRRKRRARIRVIALLTITLLGGGLYGYLGQKPAAIPEWGPAAPESGSQGKPAPPEGTSARKEESPRPPPEPDAAEPGGETVGEKETQSPRSTSTSLAADGEDPLERLRRQLSGTEIPEATQRGTADSRSSDPEAALSLAVAGAPAGTAASRRSLYRLFLDLAGRPPTREEEQELAPSSHRQRWQAVMRVATLPGWLQSTAESFQALLGREPTGEEVVEIERLATPEWPAAFWVAGLEEYGSADHRRQRSAEQRASAWIVDLTDRTPTSSAEVRVVQTALSSEGEQETVARTLVFSPRSRVPSAEESVDWWQGELFRFLLRSPTPREAQEIPALLETWPREQRRSWFLLTLASLPEYETY